MYKFLITLSLIIYVSVSQAQEAVFRFMPPNGISYTETYKRTLEKNFGNLRTDSEFTEAKTKISIIKEGQDYLVIATPTEIKVIQNGQVVDNPIVNLPLNRKIIYRINENGKIKDIKGYESFIKDIKERLPPASRNALLEKLLNAEAMIEKEIVEWNGRVGIFVGEKVSVGDRWYTEDEFTLPTGDTLKFYNVIEFSKIWTAGSKKLVKISFVYDTDVDVIKQVFEDTSKTISEHYQIPLIQIDKPSLSGGGERIVDANTMLIQSETIWRVMTMKTTLPGQDELWSTTKETREYSFQY
jgi:hypothetical protein